MCDSRPDSMRLGMLCYFDPDTYPGVYNSCNMLVENGWQVDVLGLNLYGFNGKSFDDRVRLHVVKTTGGPARFSSFIRQARQVGKKRRWQTVIGHDMLGFTAARLARVVPKDRVVFWSQDLAEPVLHTRSKALLFALKRRLLHTCPLAIAPSLTRAEAMNDFYRLPSEPIVVYNSPRLQCGIDERRDWRRELELTADDIVGVYGGGLGSLRLVPQLIDSVPKWPPGVKLVIAGYGTDAEISHTHQAVTNSPCADRMRFVGHLPSCLELLKAGAFGISLFQTDCDRRNYRYRGLSSNKIFESLALGRPILVSDNAETNALVHGHGCGVCVTDLTPSGIATAVCELTISREHLAEMGANARRVHRRETHFEKRFLPLLTRLETAAQTGTPPTEVSSGVSR